MRKKLTFLLVALFVSMFAMAGITYYPDLSVGGVKVDCWVDDDGIVYKFDSETETVEGYCYNTEANDNDAPVFDTTKEFDLVFLDYIDGYPVTSIGNGVNRSFYNLTNLISLTIPEKVTSIGTQAFYGCTKIEEIYCYNPEPPTLGTNSFGMAASSIPLGNSTDKVKVYIPYGTTQSYQANANSTSPRTWGWYEAQGYFEFIEMEEGAQGPTTEGIMDVNPTTGTRLSGSFDSITLSYDGGVTLFNEEAFPILIYSTDNTSTAVASLMYDESTSAQDDGSYTLYVYDAAGTKQEALETYGDYTFTIPELIFYLGGEDSDLGNQKLIITYTIEDATEYTITLDPEDGTQTTETISTFTISCSNGLTLLNEPGQFGDWLITIKKDGTATDNYLLHVVGEDEEATKNSYTFTFDEALSSKGEYTFTLPAGMFTVGPYNQLSKDMPITYTLTSDAAEYSEIVWEPDGESVLTELSTIYLYNYIDEDGTRATSRIKFATDGEEQVTITDESGKSYEFTTETNDAGTYIKFILDEAITTGGKYTVTIPEGAVLLGQNETPNEEEISITYQVASYDIYFDPADDSSVEKIETFTVMCDAGLVANLNDDETYDNISISTVVDGLTQLTDYYAVYDRSGQIYDETDATKQIGQTYTIYQKTTDEDGEETSAEATITEPGTYQFEIGRGLFALGDEGVSNAATTCTYHISTFEITVNEETITVADDYSSITATITADDGVDIALAEDNTEKIRVVKGASELVAYATAEQETDGAWTFTFISTADVEEGNEPEEIKLATTGDYTLTIPEGFFTDKNNEGSKSEKLDIKFSIVISFEPTIEKEEVSSDGSSVEITFSEDVTLVDDTEGLEPITITTLDENNEPVIVAYAVATFSNGILTLSFVDEEGVEVDLEPGEYTLTIPEGYFTDAAGDVSDEITDTITITATEPVKSVALFSTHFTDWYSLAEEDAQDKVIPVTTATGGNFTFTLNGVSVNPGDVTQWNTDSETGEKTTPKFEAEGALIFGKADSETDVYYVETSALGSVDEITFTEAATAKSRGVKVLVKGAEDTDWVTLYDTSLSDYSADVVIDEINRTDCQIRFENLVYNQNAYILNLKIHGTDGEELTIDTALEIAPASESNLESLESFTISYADGIELDNSTLQGYVVNEKGANKAIFDFTKTSETKGVQTGYTFTLYDVSNPETAISLTDDGTYTISIAEGAFRLGIYDETIDNDDKETTEPIEITYVIGTGVSAKTEDFVLTPENGATELTELSEFTASCEMGITLTDEDLALDVTVGNTVVAIAKYVEGDEITDDDGTIGYNIKFYDPESGEAITLTDEATYSFTIPAGTFVYGSDDTKNEEIVIYYTIGELWFTFVPSDGSTVSSLESVSVTNGLEGVGVRYLPYPEDPRETPTGLIVVLDEEGNTVATVPNYDDYVVEIWDENNPDEPSQEVIFNFDRPINTAGTYTVIIPANIIFQGKRDIDSTGDIELTITVDGTEDDDAYQLYIELDDSALGDNSSLEEVWATIQEDYPESVEALQETYDEISAEISTLRVDLLASYKAGTIVEDASEFEAQIADIQTKINSLLETASGIDGITTDATSFEGKGVYTISGQKVAAPTKAGIYIIDGKKVVIK